MLGTPLDPHAFPSPRLPLIVHTSVLPGGVRDGMGWDCLCSQCILILPHWLSLFQSPMTVLPQRGECAVPFPCVSSLCSDEGLGLGPSWPCT